MSPQTVLLSPSQDDHNLPNYDRTPGFKPFTVLHIQITFALQKLQSLCIVYDETKLKANVSFQYRKNYKYNILCLEAFGINALFQIREMRAQINSPPKQRPSVGKYREACFQTF